MDTVGPPGWPRAGGSLFPRALGACLACAGLAWFGCNDSTSPRDELIAAFGEVRPIEGRLQGLAFARYQPNARPEPSNDLAAVARRIETRAATHPSGMALADLALLDLFTGRPDRAVEALERAETRVPADASLLSDLAAAYIARAGVRDRPFDLVRAVSAADFALQRRP